MVSMLINTLRTGFTAVSLALFAAAAPATSPDMLVPTANAQWYQNIVPRGQIGRGYGHGQFLVAQQLTHPGVDIGGGCRLAVYAADAGEVVKIVKAGDPDYGVPGKSGVGNAVVIKHADAGGRPVYTAYLHMADAPLVAKGPIKRGKKIGLTGATGFADGCHLHFEVRHFTGIRGLYNEDWKNIYGTGDKRRDPVFLNGWSDPKSWVAGLVADRSPFQNEYVNRTSPENSLTAIAKTFRGFGNQGIQFSMTVSVRRVEKGVLVRLDSVTGRQFSGATFNPVEPNESFALGLHVVTRKTCQDCIPGFVKQSPLGLQLKNRRLDPYALPVEVFVPDIALADADVIGVALYGNGILFLAPKSDFSIDELMSTVGKQVGTSDAAKFSVAERLAIAESALAAALAETESLRESLGDKAELRRQLAAALAAKVAAEQSVNSQMSEAQQRAALLSVANRALETQQAKSAESLRKLAVLNEQVAALRAKLRTLQALLETAYDRNKASQVEITNLGARLNSAMMRVAAEAQKRAKLEEATRKRLEEEARTLERYRSEFFGKLRDSLSRRDGVKIDGDRVVFSSGVLFEPGSTNLTDAGKAQISGVVGILTEVVGAVPPKINWVLQVDGHTDNIPLSGTGRYKDNWELSQARALAVVRYMTAELGFPPNRLAAAGFGEFQPVALGSSPEARSQNRRIELKLTER